MKRVHSEQEEGATNETMKRIRYHDVYNSIAYLGAPISHIWERYGCLAYRGQPYPKVIMEFGQELSVNVAWWKDEPHGKLILELMAVTIDEPQSQIEMSRSSLPTLFTKAIKCWGLITQRVGLSLRSIFPMILTKLSKNCCQETKQCPFWTNVTRK